MSVSLTIQEAKKNVRAEIASSEKLALYLFEIGVLKNPKYQTIENEFKPFNLQSLIHMRHIKIEFFNIKGELLDSNTSETKIMNQAPDWFVNTMSRASDPWEPKRLPLVILGDHKGDIVISPDPSYEYGEIWNQVEGALYLIGFFFVLINILVIWILSNALSPIQNILYALDQLEEGNLKVRIPNLKTIELKSIGQKFNRMVKVLEESVSKNHLLSQQLITLQESERKKLARDLHDEFGQSLTAIHADAAALKVLAQKEYPKIKPSVNAISDISKYLMELVSSMLGRLKLGVLDDLGLEEAFKEYIGAWVLRNKSIDVEYKIHIPQSFKINESISVASYRLLQEALTNIQRHAHASKVNITIHLKKLSDRKHSIDMVIKDNGRGFKVRHEDGFGLTGMKERIRLVKGNIVIKSTPRKGVILHVKLPLSSKKAIS